jgi:hypothetical protein
MRRLLVPLAAVVVAVALVGSTSVFAQGFKLVIGQGNDGTLYVVTDHGRYTLVPVRISDDEVNASVDLGPVSGDNLAIAWPTPVPTAVPAATAAPVAAFQPVTVSGRGEEQTRPFSLPAGSYTSEWKIAGGSPRCFKTVRLYNTARQITTTALLPMDYYDAAPKTGTTQVYNLPEGTYYAGGVGSGCDWTITLKPL